MQYKTIFRKIQTIQRNPKALLFRFWYCFEPFVSDETFLRVLFWIRVGYWPNLKEPRSFNEKLQWLKLHYQRPEYTEMVDKVSAKEYVARIIGAQYTIPTLGVWDNINDIDWDSLPNRFVLKAAHDSGGVVVCRDKNTLDIDEAKAKLSGAGERDYTRYNKEYPYKDVPHRFIAEEYKEDEPGKGLKDYKIFCFNGEPRFLYLSQGLENHATARMSFLNADWTFAPFRRADYLQFECLPEKPRNYEKMIDIARTLSKGIPHVRVDLYNVDGAIYFGELTFFTCSGMIPFEPGVWDYKLGDLISLPKE